MKALFTLSIALFLTSIFCIAQTDSSRVAKLMNVKGAASVQQVIELPEMTAEQIYKVAAKWVATTFVSPSDVIKANLENELIKGQGSITGAYDLGLVTEDVLYTFTIDIKDGKLRFTISNLLIVNSKYGNYPAEGELYKADGTERSRDVAQRSIRNINRFSNKLITSLKKTLNGEKKDDW